ncbi:MAG: SAM-dependent methyltransferase [Burkholderiales bacterium]
MRRPVFAAAFAALLVVVTLPAAAQRSAHDYEPQVGQAGKDVIWVPTPDAVVERMLRMAQVSAADYVVDLGAGDGKIASAAARHFGARALGIEFNPDMVAFAQRAAEQAGVADRARIVQGDIFATDFSRATVVTMYLLPALNLRLRPTILGLRPGTRVVSHSFSMDDWEPDELSAVGGRRIYFWVVPAQVAGAWSLERAGGDAAAATELTLEQHYQHIEGTVSLGPVLAGLRDPRLQGDRISFAYVDARGLRVEFNGRVDGRRMEGRFRASDGGEGRWTAGKK